MFWTVPFLVVVGLLAPLMSVASRRLQAKAGSTPTDLPSPRALAVQTLVVQAIVCGLAWLALLAPGVSVVWRSKVDVGTAFAAIVVVAASLLVASLEARRPLGPADALRKRLRSVGAADPLWLSVMLVAAIVEEFAYRGVLTGMLGGYFGLGMASLVSAGLFGLAHSTQGLRGFAMSAAFGLALQWVVSLSGGLALAVIAHLAYDLGVAALGRRLAGSEAKDGHARSDS